MGKLIGEKHFERTHFFDSTEFTDQYIIETNLLDISKNIKDPKAINYRIIKQKDDYWINKIINSLAVENVEYTSIISIQSILNSLI